MHGWVVRASSAGPGHGSTFEIVLPLVQSAPADAPSRGGLSAVIPASARRKRVLVVDDEPDNREVITSIVRDLLGYAVVTADSGRLALAQARRRPDVILLDIRMPDLDGLEVTRRLKADPTTAPIPILALTALSDADDRQAALDAGCLGCITKPFNNDELATEIARALGPSPDGSGS
jgi:CheY-like chemotaxis protein